MRPTLLVLSLLLAAGSPAAHARSGATQSGSDAAPCKPAADDATAANGARQQTEPPMPRATDNRWGMVGTRPHGGEGSQQATEEAAAREADRKRAAQDCSRSEG